jgi:hypothetical protein
VGRGAIGGRSAGRRNRRVPLHLRAPSGARRLEDRELAQLDPRGQRGLRVPPDQVGRRDRRGRERVPAGPDGVLGAGWDGDDRLHRHRGLAAAERVPRRPTLARRPARTQRGRQTHDRGARWDGRQEPGGRIHARVRVGATCGDVRAGDRGRRRRDLPRSRLADPGPDRAPRGRDGARGRRSLRSRGELRGAGRVRRRGRRDRRVVTRLRSPRPDGRVRVRRRSGGRAEGHRGVAAVYPLASKTAEPMAAVD